MNNIFDFKRFGNYFLYDLRNAKNNYGLNLLIMGLTPVYLFFFYVFLSLMRGNGIGSMPEGMKIGGIIAIVIVVIFGAGARLYGTLTEKRAGSNFLMLPASTLEKWLSMVLMVCIVVPVVLFFLLIVSDSLMGLLFPQAYGARILDLDLAGISSGQKWVGDEVAFNLPAVVFLVWCESLLVFTLGAICFKKAKVAKTILCLFGLGMLASALLVVIAGTGNLDSAQFEAMFDSPDKLVDTINWTISIVNAVVMAALLWGIWYRLRTLKH